jgi:uncharacterized Zn-binding protein involved in type VI secretion
MLSLRYNHLVACRSQARTSPATVADMCPCVGSLDSTVKSSATDLISNKAAARLGDVPNYCGAIVLGRPTVIIGG